MLHQPVIALHRPQFNLFDDTSKIVLTEIAVDVEDGPFDVRLMLAQVADILGYTFDDCGILPAGAHPVLLYLVVADKLIQFGSKFCIVGIGVELCPEIEGVLRREVALEAYDSFLEILKLSLFGGNLVAQLFQYVSQWLHGFQLFCCRDFRRIGRTVQESLHLRNGLSQFLLFFT